MILQFDNKDFEKGNKEMATASLGAFVPGSHDEHLLHGRDASIRHDNFPAAEGLIFASGVNHHPRHSFGTPDDNV